MRVIMLRISWIILAYMCTKLEKYAILTYAQNRANTRAPAVSSSKRLQPVVTSVSCGVNVPRAMRVRLCCGELSEWLKEHDWKSCIRLKRIPGSNPGLSAITSGGRIPARRCAREGWQSGRMRRSRKPFTPLGVRGFESLLLRHIFFLLNTLIYLHIYTSAPLVLLKIC